MFYYYDNIMQLLLLFFFGVCQPDVSNATQQGVLGVQGIDFCIDSNGERHHTSKFNLMTRNVDRCLVVRRGNSFKLDLLLNRPYDASKDAISFIFYVSDVETRGPSDETSIAVPLLEKGSESSGAWNATYGSQMDNHLIVTVTPAPDSIVASWRLEVDTKLTGGSSLNYRHPLPIYVLFNPWCSNDSVFMPDESHRDEYVLQDAGIIYRGVGNIEKPSPWNYAQYEKNVLDCALYLVREIGKVKGRARSDAILTARALSAAVNEEDDSGVLVGKWAKDREAYSGGTHPCTWVGSLDIIQKYYENKKPVKYAQCWVYAGVLTTIFRALGIPCRAVTGYEIAHDSQGNLTIDLIIDEQGEILKKKTKDDIWNYHVWNEVWMDRPDLGPNYGGWQALDSTPQKTSEDMYKCGPASLRAILDGEVQRPYDTRYVFAQVNADKLKWKYSGESQPLKLISRDTGLIGQYISTKAVGKIEREDITNTYKYPESSREERMSKEKALRESPSLARYYLNTDFYDVTFDFELRDDIKIGQEFSVVVHVTNRSISEAHKVKVFLGVSTMSYTGAIGEIVKRSKFDLNLAPEAKDDVQIRVTFDEYYNKLVDQASFRIYCLAKIVEKEFDYYAQNDFRVRNPDIKISIEGKPVSHQQCRVNLRVENPLPIPLTKCKFYVQGAGIEKQIKMQLDEIIAPGNFATTQFMLSLPGAGWHQLSAKFTSMEILDVDGFLRFEVAMPNATNGTNGILSDTVESH